MDIEFAWAPLKGSQVPPPSGKGKFHKNKVIKQKLKTKIISGPEI